jgi:hypothetical protein
MGLGDGVRVRFCLESSLPRSCEWGERLRFLLWSSLPQLSSCSYCPCCSGMWSLCRVKLELSHGLLYSHLSNVQPMGWLDAVDSHSLLKSDGLDTPSSSKYRSNASSSSMTCSGSQVSSPKAQRTLKSKRGDHL